MLEHKCYGLADKVCGWCQCDKKMCQDVLVEGELFFCPIPNCLVTDTLVVDSMPVASHRAHQMVAPTKPLTQSKQVITKGKAIPHPVT